MNTNFALLFDPQSLPGDYLEFLAHYTETPVLSNQALYRKEAARTGTDLAKFLERTPIGHEGQCHSLSARRVRWWQQTLKRSGWLEPLAGQRGFWRLTEPARKALTPQTRGRVMLGYSTALGVALWASSEDVFSRLDEPITLWLSSPVYPIAHARSYGTIPVTEYVDWLCAHIELIVRNLRDGGVLALNISNDVFEPRSPARSTYRERLVLALCDRFALYKLDEVIWSNPSKPPGPTQWASLKRFQLNTGYEPVYIFTNNPHRCVADNRRVLQSHTDRHLALMKNGGENRTSVHSDGAYRLHHGSYGKRTEGRIPKNVITCGHAKADPDLKRAKEMARRRGLPTHGAPMPLELADFLVKYLSEAGDLVGDSFSGWNTTGYAAQINGRRWISCEKHGEYVVGGAERFSRFDGFENYA